MGHNRLNAIAAGASRTFKLFSPAALLDDTGAVVERYEYDAFGRIKGASGLRGFCGGGRTF